MSSIAPISSTCLTRVLASQFFLGMCLLLIFSFIALLGGCLPTSRPVNAPLADLTRDETHSARLSCFLTLKESEGPAIRLEVSTIEVLGDGLWIQVNRAPLVFDSAAIGAGQLFLGGRAVPPGIYQRVRLTVNKGSVRQADGKFAVIEAKPFQMEVPLAEPIRLANADSSSVFLTWDVQNSQQDNNTLRPVLDATLPVRQLQVDLIYAACPDIDTIFVVRADKNWVVDSFGLKGSPTYLASDPDTSRQRLYVLAFRERAIKVVDLSSQRVVNMFPIPLGDAPTYMTISTDGSRAFLLDENNGYLSSIDLASGRSIARVRLGFRPQYAVNVDEQNLLAVSLALSQKLVFLDPLNLTTVRSLPTGSTPQGLLVLDNRLYVAERGEHSVSVVDLLSKGNLTRLTSVGFGPRRLQTSDSQIYISNYDGGSLAVVMPGQLGVIQEINGLGRPLEMVFNQSYRRLYVAEEEAAALAVVDTNSNLLLGRIFLGARPAGLAVIQ